MKLSQKENTISYLIHCWNLHVTIHFDKMYSTIFFYFRQKDRNDVGGYVDGQVGKFKDGVQFVKKTDLKGFASKRKK